MNTTTTWLTRDLPPYTQLDDPEALYGTEFGRQWATDVEYEWPKLLAEYTAAGPHFRQGVNRAFVSLIGYTLPSLVELAHGNEPS